jgi:maleylpyruvate isomerase
VRATDPPAWGPLADSAIRFLGTAQALTDDELHDTSALPGWTRAHVLAHVAQAADSRTRLLRAARAGRRPVRGVVPSLRGELEYHHVDLAAGYEPADWPDDFVATELSRVTGLMDRRADAPPMTLTGLAMLRIGTSPPVDVTGPPAAMLAWLAGRSDGSDLDPGSASLPGIPPLA